MADKISNKIKCYNKGKEIFLDKDDLKKCFFCDKPVIPKDFLWQKTQFISSRESLGEIPNDTAGNIGNKIICKDCLGDLEMLLPFECCDD